MFSKGVCAPRPGEHTPAYSLPAGSNRAGATDAYPGEE